MAAWSWRRNSALDAGQHPVESPQHFLPPELRALVEAFVCRAGAEASVLHAQHRAAFCWRERERDDGPRPVLRFLARGAPAIRQPLVRLDHENLAIGDAVPVRIGLRAEVELVADNRLEVVLHQPFGEELRL